MFQEDFEYNPMEDLHQVSLLTTNQFFEIQLGKMIEALLFFKYTVFLIRKPFLKVACAVEIKLLFYGLILLGFDKTN